MDHATIPENQPTRKHLVEALAALVVEALQRARAKELNVNSKAKRERQERKPAPKH